MLLKNREQEMSERKLVIMEQRAKQAVAAQKVVGNETLSAEEKANKLKELFGITK